MFRSDLGVSYETKFAISALLGPIGSKIENILKGSLD